MATALKYFTVYFLSGLKFIFGPTLGVAYDIPDVITIILTSLGMMTTIHLFTFFGEQLHRFSQRFRKNKKTFNKKSRLFVKIWRRFGLKGLCFLTPLILTPPGGGLLVNLIGARKSEILKWMWISAILWSTVITLIVRYAFWLIEDFVPV